MKNDLEFGTDGIRGPSLKKEFLRSLPNWGIATGATLKVVRETVDVVIVGYKIIWGYVSKCLF